MPKPFVETRAGLQVKLDHDLARQFRVVAAVRDLNLNTALTEAVAAYVAAVTPAERAACALPTGRPATA